MKFLGFFNIFLNLNIFASLAVLEEFERVLRASWSHLWPSWGRLGAILGRLGAILGRLGRLLASQNLPKIAPRGLQDASQDEVQHRPQLEGLQGPRLVEILD